MLTISVKNFGPIAEGSVDLKPLTIFVGPSNTGKSYMATAVHAVMRAVEGRTQVPYTRNLERRGLAAGAKSKWEVPANVVDAIREWVKRQDGSDWVDQDIPVKALPEEVYAELTRSTKQVVHWFHGDVLHQLHQSYRGNPEIVNRAKESEHFRLSVERESPALKVDIGLTNAGGSNAEFDISRASVGAYRIENWGAAQQQDEEIYPGIYTDFFTFLRISAAEIVFEGLPYSTYFLPASRTGIVQGQKILAASIIRQSALLGSQRVNIPALPGVTTEFLSDLISLDKSSLSHRRNDQWDKAIRFIESHVLQGEIDLDESAGLPYPEIAYATDSGKFSLEHSSSMVTELAPLILFLKYLVNPGDLLILEEPESHLHPAAQRQLARGIVRLVNAGVKVLITTHSDIFVSQINNLLRASYASKRWLRENGFSPEDCLKHDDVSAYLFRMNEEAGGSRVERLEIQRDIGIEDPLFHEVINDLYEETLLVERVRPK